MLTFLSIANYALIDTLQIDLNPGFTALTGETGAGKSILLGALCLILGERMENDAFRENDKPVCVEGAFDLTRHRDIVKKITALSGIEIEDESEIIIRREVSSQGKSKCFLNGAMLPMATLKQIGAFLIDVHGQHDHQLLFDRQWHGIFLDEFGGLEAEIDEYTTIFKQYQELAQQKHHCEEQEMNKARELDILTFQINEIERVGIKGDEDHDLEHERIRLANAEKISNLAQGAYAMLYDGETSALDRIGTALNKLKELGKIDDSVTKLTGLLEQAYIEVNEIAHEVQDYVSDLSFDEGRLEDVQERLDAISKLKGKYGATTDAILKFLEEARVRRDELTMNEERLEELGRDLSEIEMKLSERAKRLHDKRVKVAKKIKMSIEGELNELGMKDAHFDVVVEQGELNSRGFDRIEFFVTANKGEESKPLSKIASGGEVARIMLACKKILARVDQVATIIFDEIDANIGGRLGKTVGEKIKEIARERQVLLVTHLPQIASCADQHFKVFKEHKGARTVTRCGLLSNKERVEELAQMMSGPAASTISKQHAAEMMGGR